MKLRLIKHYLTNGFFFASISLSGWIYAEEGLYLELVLNGKNTGRIIHAIPHEGDWKIDSDELRALGLKMDDEARGQVHLKTLGDVSYSESDQRLFLQLPASYFELQRFGYDRQFKHVDRARSDFGVLLNYDLVVDNSRDGKTSASLWHEAYGFSPAFYGVNRGLIQDKEFTEDYLRFESFIHYDNIDGLWSVTGGDIINSAPDWGRSVRMGGIRFTRDYALNPNVVPHPLPEFFGQSAVPTSVELIINEQIRWQQQVEPGPYAINALPFVGGSGIAEVVTTDAQGIQSRQTVNFYVSSELLAKHLFDFDVSLGARREQFGFLSNEYGDELLGSIAARYGLSRYLTPEVLLQYGEGLTLYGVGAVAQLGNWGVINFSHSESEFNDEQGDQQTIGYNVQYTNVGVYARASRRDEYFQDLASIETFVPQRYRDMYQAGITASHQQIGSLNLGYIRMNETNVAMPYYVDQSTLINAPRQLGDYEFMSATWSRPFSSGIQLLAQYNRLLGNNGGDIFSLQLTFPLGGHRQGSVSHVNNNSRESYSRVQAMRSPPFHGGLGWHLAVDDSPARNRYGYLDWRADSFDLLVSSSESAGQSRHYGSLRGSLIGMGGDVYLSRQVVDAFAVVNTGYPDVPIYSGNHYVGNTNRDGKLLLPRLHGYSDNKIALKADDLPPNVSIESEEVYVVPKRRSGVNVELPVKQRNSFTFTAVDSQGKALPVGTVLVADKDMDDIWVGWDGNVFIEHIDDSIQLFSETGDCVIHIEPLQNATEELPNIGNKLCEVIVRGGEW